MNRIDRVTAILIHLQSKKIVKAQDIAERFNISLRTVYRDIKTLEDLRTGEGRRTERDFKELEVEEDKSKQHYYKYMKNLFRFNNRYS